MGKPRGQGKKAVKRIPQTEHRRLVAGLPQALAIILPLIPQGAGGSALSVQETSRRLMSVRSTLTGILAERSGLSVRRVQRLTSRDTYLSAERALELGFATSIVTSKKED